MKQASGAPTTTTSQRCVTKDDLTELNVNNDRNPSCKMTLVRSSRTKQEIHMDCSDSPKRTGTIVIEALNSESIKFNMQIAITKNGQPINVTVNGTSKWLGATCTDAK